MAEELAVGIALTTDPERTRGKLVEFCRCLSEASGMKVTPHGMWHYHHLLDALAATQLDLVWLPPILALRATGSGVCRPIALPVRHGVSTYSTALFTRPDSQIRTIEDLKGVRAAWVDRQSASGYLIIRALLRSKGVALDAAFAENTFLGAHDAVARAVLDGDADVGATFVYLDPDSSTGVAFPKSAGWGKARVHTICYAGSIPSDVIAVGKHLDDTTRSLVQKVLVDAPEHAELGRAAVAEVLGVRAATL